MDPPPGRGGRPGGLLNAMHQMMMGYNSSATFDIALAAIPAAFALDGRRADEINYGGKMLLPTSALDTLTRMDISYPMMFRLEKSQRKQAQQSQKRKQPDNSTSSEEDNSDNSELQQQASTHLGVLEFSAEEGNVILPNWAMNQLSLQPGNLVRIKYTRLPNHVSFLNISNPRAMLEVELRKFACLTKGDRICVRYNSEEVEFEVKEVRPRNAVSIIECDMNVEFDAPVGYVDPAQNKAPQQSGSSVKPSLPPAGDPLAEAAAAAAAAQPTGFVPFSGSGHRLDGKAAKPANAPAPGFRPGAALAARYAGSTSSTAASASEPSPAGLPPILPNYDYQPGTLSFVRHDYSARSAVERAAREGAKNAASSTSTSSAQQNPFQGAGHSIKPKRRAGDN